MIATNSSTQSPLSAPQAPFRKGSGAAGPTNEQRFWEVDCYYKSRHNQHWSHSLDEDFEEFVQFHEGTFFCAERVEERAVCIGEDNDGGDPKSTYVVLRGLDPRDPTSGKTLRIGFWPAGGTEISSGYTKIDEPLVILALAGTGLIP